MNSSKIMANSLDDSVFDGVAREETSQEIKDIVEGLNTNLSGSLTANVVKSVQMQQCTIDNKSHGANSVIFNISEVNLDKTVFHVQGTVYQGSLGTQECWRIVSVTPTSVVLYPEGLYTMSGSSYVTLQVVEYY